MSNAKATSKSLLDASKENKLIRCGNKDASAQTQKKKDRNVFTYMESEYKSKGPKSFLYRSIKDNRRIKVWTRSHSYVRSICSGYLVAFDQFWNLAMIDVDEVYKVPSSSLVTATCDAKEVKTIESVNHEKKDLTKKIDELKLIEDDKSLENFVENLNLYKSGRFNLFERHVNQMLIRGDNVVTITFAD